MVETTNWPELEFVCNGGGGCVMIEEVAGAVVIRDSKNPHQAGLVFSRKEYADFRRRVRDGSWPRKMLRAGARTMRGGARTLRRAASVAQVAVYGPRSAAFVLRTVRGWLRYLTG
ncbi:DUF397 domain-containing protein [Actinomadura rubrisoli]|uniref:DUF397 domain-containing protein n=1 Tax=Actinomadura rubrisoli TaxID=2530368 RepID=A0A4R5B1I0_9ACTN|nr:DUF397 domain-containing protein [Actinomadura rubrisoli]TDD78006.1 DUF397 domain-containing protein [Actinomadura rubrisoli]